MGIRAIFAQIKLTAILFVLNMYRRNGYKLVSYTEKLKTRENWAILLHLWKCIAWSVNVNAYSLSDYIELTP